MPVKLDFEIIAGGADEPTPKEVLHRLEAALQAADDAHEDLHGSEIAWARERRALANVSWQAGEIVGVPTARALDSMQRGTATIVGAGPLDRVDVKLDSLTTSFLSVRSAVPPSHTVVPTPASYDENRVGLSSIAKPSTSKYQPVRGGTNRFGKPTTDARDIVL